VAVKFDANCTVAFSPGKAVSSGKAPVMLRAGKGVRPRLGLLAGHETMNPFAAVKAWFMVREVWNDEPQGTPLLTLVDTHVAWRTSVPSILADAAVFAGVVRSGIAPAYADEPTSSNTWLIRTKDRTSVIGKL